jgi:hypothetical protein
MNCGYHPARLAASRNITSLANSVWLALEQLKRKAKTLGF